MKVVVIGGTGIIGSKIVLDLHRHGHDPLAASPHTGVDTLTGEGLEQALAGAGAVIDVSSSPSFDDAAVLEFFETSTRRILDAVATAGVGHLVALSVVGSERLPASGYLRAKVAQETLIQTSAVPYSIVRATQFFELISRIADDATENGTVRLPPVLFQPVAADDVASAVSSIALGSAVMGTIEVAGPQLFRLDELVRRALAARGDERTVEADPRGRYFGTELEEHSLVPGKGAFLAATRYRAWQAARR
jgi:uncharacterized protein YbjT (DUF2867 family)